MNDPLTQAEPAAPHPDPDPPPRRVRGRIGTIGAWLLRALLLSWLLVGAGVLALRYLLMPAVGDFRAQIEVAASASLGLPVSVGTIEGGWSGWRPRLWLTALRIADADGRPALVLPQVDATLAWSSLLRGEPHFHRLEISAAELELRRDAGGALFVAGLPVASGRGEQGVGLAWLLAQRQIVIHGARLRWTDEARGAPELVLEDVAFRLDQRAAPARFALQAQPPPALASALVLRGELQRFDAERPAASVGRLYLELERADLGAWQPWVDYALPLSGQGGVRAWLDSEGDALALTLDVALDGVRTRLAAELPELAVSRLEGRLAFARDPRRTRLGARQLALHTDAGLLVAPTDVELDLQHAADGTLAGGRLAASRLDFSVLAALSAHLPIDAAVRERLAAFAPQGSVEALALSWDGDVAAPRAWTLSARYADLGLLAREGLPGLGGLSGTIDGNERNGRFRIDGRGAHIDLPEVFESGRLDFDRLQAEGGWQRRDGRLEIALDGAEFDNVDAAGSASGRYWPQDGEIDLQARLSRAEGTAVWRYLPRTVNQNTHDWVRRGIRAAAVPDARLRLRGRLADFPYRAGEGQFLVTVRVADAVVDYAPDWPPIEGLFGELRFEGPGMRITADRARILGVDLAEVVADVPELDQHPTEIMTISGRALGPTAEFLRFVSASPVSRRIGGFTDTMRAEGRGELGLKLVMPLRNVVDTTVEGEFRFADNRIELAQGLPALERAGGRVRFTADTLTIPEARAQLLGHPLRVLARTGGDGGVRFEASGKADMTALRAAYATPLLDGLSGAADWSAAVVVGKAGTRVELNAGLTGVASSLPAPLNKSSAESWPLQLVVDHPAGQARSAITLQIASLARAELVRAGADWRQLSGGVALGRATADAVPRAERGLRVAAVLDRLDVDAWRRVFDSGASAEPGAAATEGGFALPLVGITLAADEVNAFGQRLRAVDLRAEPDAGGWKARIDSDLTAGDLDWRSAGSGTLTARLRHLRIAGEGGEGQGAGESAGQGAGGTVAEAEARIEETPPRQLPALDVVAERFELRGLELGRLEVFARNRGGLWQLERLALVNADGRLAGSGQWQAEGRQRTRMEFSFETADVGQFSRRVGYPDVVRGGRASLGGELGWQGAPTRIDYRTLAGALRLDAGAGQFNKLEPGVGRLLGILSLQALPRRITLDFRDVFSEGFAFDRISGSIELAAGVMRTTDLEIRGPAARVKMSGAADLVGETQDLRVFVQPTLSESIAIGAAAGLLNPAVGVVTYLAQKMLSDPIEKLFAFEYAITGSWADPQVAKLGRAEVAPAD
ncbi:YhdP family protein [Thauera sp.]|uniref:YhdP family protein n=1 Tax=Thauera sp. TaxID=1905334 RepID=UPI002B543C7F|nr:YhdP family protein [Thauera sp.]HRP23690.1 YhdP family protein [Thauera sp.]